MQSLKAHTPRKMMKMFASADISESNYQQWINTEIRYTTISIKMRELIFLIQRIQKISAVGNKPLHRTMKESWIPWIQGKSSQRTQCSILQITPNRRLKHEGEKQ